MTDALHAQEDTGAVTTEASGPAAAPAATAAGAPSAVVTEPSGDKSLPRIDRYAHASEAIVGARGHQEDYSLFVFAEGGPQDTATGERGAGELLAVLADGMGGHVAGETASRTGCAHFAESYIALRAEPRERLTSALDAANASLASAINADGALDGMGCTIVGAAFGERGLRWISVGDSPLYLYRERALYRLNEDHSMAPVVDDMADRGLLGREAAVRDPRRHMLRSALTGVEIDLVDIGEKLLVLEPGDLVLLASDGLDVLSHRRIAEIIATHADGDPAEIVALLIDAVEAHGAPDQDNTTVMAVQPKFA
ncbi:MAG: protein phosphatase 2C domain-containing protein [Pseudomonadota bacterium]